MNLIDRINGKRNRTPPPRPIDPEFVQAAVEHAQKAATLPEAALPGTAGECHTPAVQAAIDEQRRQAEAQATLPPVAVAVSAALAALDQLSLVAGTIRRTVIALPEYKAKLDAAGDENALLVFSMGPGTGLAMPVHNARMLKDTQLWRELHDLAQATNAVTDAGFVLQQVLGRTYEPEPAGEQEQPPVGAVDPVPGPHPSKMIGHCVVLTQSVITNAGTEYVRGVRGVLRELDGDYCMVRFDGDNEGADLVAVMPQWMAPADPQTELVLPRQAA